MFPRPAFPLVQFSEGFIDMFDSGSPVSAPFAARMLQFIPGVMQGLFC
jgi:hypothetical protein